eukprot:GHVU01025846.1.p1 GENE.GHVU01025846.1~~GHVU01025846.1.p1  ORF type:complete len:135 (+),score=6.77 GHVU01025846.1:778-1182(+)
MHVHPSSSSCARESVGRCPRLVSPADWQWSVEPGRTYARIYVKISKYVYTDRYIDTQDRRATTTIAGRRRTPPFFSPEGTYGTGGRDDWIRRLDARLVVETRDARRHPGTACVRERITAPLPRVGRNLRRQVNK